MCGWAPDQQPAAPRPQGRRAGRPRTGSRLGPGQARGQEPEGQGARGSGGRIRGLRMNKMRMGSYKMARGEGVTERWGI